MFSINLQTQLIFYPRLRPVQNHGPREQGPSLTTSIFCPFYQFVHFHTFGPKTCKLFFTKRFNHRFSVYVKVSILVNITTRDIPTKGINYIAFCQKEDTFHLFTSERSISERE